MRCEVADEPIVVLKLQPMKPGNGVEGKTEVTRRQVRGEKAQAKSGVFCEGVKFDGKVQWNRT